MKPLLLALLALVTGSWEPNDRPVGALPIKGFAWGTLDYDGDPEWWRIQRNHPATIVLYVDTGIGPLCGCAKGDPFYVDLWAYDVSGTLIFSHVGTVAGLDTITLTGLPLGEPVYLLLTGTTVGPYGWGDYRLLIF